MLVTFSTLLDERRLRLFAGTVLFGKVFLEWRLGTEENLWIHLVRGGYRPFHRGAQTPAHVVETFCALPWSFLAL